MPLPGRKIRGYLDSIDGQLLLFLVLLCNVKVAVKGFALLLLLWRHRNHWKDLLTRPPLPVLFYPAAALLGLLSALWAGRFLEAHYGWAYLGTLSSWIACGILSLGMYGEAKKGDSSRIYRTLEVFLLLNAAVSFLQLGSIILETGALNPYRYQGNFQKYFINTGDYIKGLSFDTSTTNAVLCATGLLLFAQRGRWVVAVASLFALVLTASNLLNVLTLAALLFLFFFRSGRAQKSILALCLLPFLVFWARISPQNTSYAGLVLGLSTPKAAAAAPTISATAPTLESLREAFARHWLDSMGGRLAAVAPVNVHTAERPALPADNIHSPAFQHRDDSGATRQLLKQTAARLGAAPPPRLGSRPGKLIALEQTGKWLRAHPSRIITGSGPAAYSSKMAFKATGLGIAGHYPSAIAYRSADFEKGQLALYLSYFSASEKLHSVVHSPNSVYLQMLG
ncbi:MAG: hypothetical protein EOO15_11795, partial [Chitinophagaceae bacterium]